MDVAYKNPQAHSEERVEIRLFGGPADGRAEEVPLSFVQDVSRVYRHREHDPPPLNCFSDYIYQGHNWCTEDGDLAVAFVYGNKEKHEDAVRLHVGDGVPIIEEDAFDLDENN